MRLAVLSLACLIFGAPFAPAAARAQMPDSQRIDGARFDALAKRAVANWHPGGDAVLRPVAPTRDQIVDAGPVALVLESPIAGPSYVNVPIDVEVDGTRVRTVYVGYRVQRLVWTAVAARDLVAGTVLTRDDVVLAHVPAYGRLSNGTDVLVGRKIAWAFRKGQPIYIEQTQVDQIVKPGSSVVLIVDDGPVSVVAQAVARNGGGLGEQVNVYDPSTNKTLTGTVVGRGRVRLTIMGEGQ